MNNREFITFNQTTLLKDSASQYTNEKSPCHVNEIKIIAFFHITKQVKQKNQLKAHFGSNKLKKDHANRICIIQGKRLIIYITLIISPCIDAIYFFRKVYICKFKTFLITYPSIWETADYTLTLVRVGFLGVRFAVGGGRVKLHPLSKTRQNCVKT